MDGKRFDGLARTVAEHDEERDRDRSQFDTLTRLVAAKGSRRAALAGLMGGAGALLGQVSQPTAAQCRGKEGKNKHQCRRREREDRPPGAGLSCQDKLFGLCTNFSATPCCNNMRCTPTAAVVVTACQFPCQTDDDCQRKFPHKGLVCRPDIAVCPFLAKRCVPRL